MSQPLSVIWRHRRADAREGWETEGRSPDGMARIALLSAAERLALAEQEPLYKLAAWSGRGIALAGGAAAAASKTATRHRTSAAMCSLPALQHRCNMMRTYVNACWARERAWRVYAACTLVASSSAGWAEKQRLPHTKRLARRTPRELRELCGKANVHDRRRCRAGCGCLARPARSKSAQRACAQA